LLVDLVSFLHSDSPFFLAENYPKAITPSGVRVATFYALTGNLRQHIEKASAQLLYLPPSSPELNPIEKAWSKLKQRLRSAKARTREALEAAIAETLPQITSQNATAWFRGYGMVYRTSQKSLGR